MRRLIAFSVLLAVLCLSGWATTYYVDFTGGLDSNSGQTPELAWKTIAKINSSSFSAGDSILFKRGETWREQLTVPSSGSAGLPITFGAYGTGVNPIISGADLIIPGSSWANHSGNIWVATVTTQPYQVFFNGTRGTLVANHDACVAPLDWFWESNVLYVYGASDPDTLYTSPGIEAASRQFCIFGNIKSYLAIDGVDVCKTNGTYTLYGCITVYSGTDITVKNLEAKYGISNIGVIAISNFTVEDCTSTYALRAGIFAYNEGGEGGLVIRRNVASHNGYEGILLQGNPTLPRISSASIYGNTCDANSTGIYCHFTNSANIYDNICTNGHSLANEEYGIAMESCSSCSVHDNEVGDNDNQGISFYGGDSGGNSDYNLIYNNYVHGHTDGPGYAISFGAYATGFFNGNQVYYNVIPDQKYGILFDHENVGGVVYNNVVYGSSTAGMYIGDVNPGLAIKNNIIYGTTICLNANAVTTGLVHSNNCYYRESGTAVSYNGSTYTMANVTTFEASAMATDPLMTDPVGGIFTLQSSSPCINAGVDVGLTTDYLENPISGLPDIGAYEYVSGGGPPPVYYVDSSITDTYVGSATPDFVTYNHLTFEATGGADYVYKTIADINACTFVPDDSIYFRKGQTWRETLTIPSSGTSGHPITFGAFGTGADPIIDGGGARNNSIYITTQNYITIQDLHLTGWKNRGIYGTTCDGIVIQRCTISGGDLDTAITHGIQIQNTDALHAGIQILNNTIGTISTTISEGVTYTGIFVNGVNGAIISGNTVNTTYTKGILLTGSEALQNTNCTIENNHVYGGYSFGISNLYSDGSIIRYNHIHDIVGGGLGVGQFSDSCQVYYNLIHDLTNDGSTTNWNGIDINNNSQNGSCYNNTVYKVHNHCQTLENATAACNGWTVKNNIYDATGNTGAAVPMRIYGITTLTANNNDLRPFSATKDYGSNLVSNPSFETFTGTADDGTGDTFTSWTNTLGTGGKNEAVTNADAYLGVTRPIPNGTYCVKLTKATGANSIKTQVSLVAWTPYEIRYKALSNGSGTGQFVIYTGTSYLMNDGTWGTIEYLTPLGVTVSDTTWTQKTLRFIPNVTASFWIVYQNLTNSQPTYIDDFYVYRQGDVVVKYSPATINWRPYNFADYKTLTGQDANSISADPLFVSTVTPDFHLQDTSPCINAGVNVGLTEDYAGNPLVGVPDIGAYEWQGVDRFPPRLPLRLPCRVPLRKGG